MQAEMNRRSMTSQAILLLQQGVETNVPLNNLVVTLPPFKGKRPLTDALLAEARNVLP